ncbi:hypothetical protein SLEP1_g26624 [Rubroshorea leprosula]|uniref:Uncharacterized protein n=1 Tax=Rubroshorea leprosula TaxID=152421 RepID=A0AAV5JX98_9ROSI|nr:hypothetical protein SLEP1_g26624 [Rubroshorea leprosula]
MISVVRVSLSFSSFINSANGEFWRKPITCYSVSRTKIAALQQKGFRVGTYKRHRWSFLEVGRGKDGILVKEEQWRRKKRVVLVRFNQGFGFNGGGAGGGGGGGGRDNSSNARVLGNLAFAIGLTYLSMTGQLNWLLDALFSIWLLAVVLPIVGLGAFLWWAGRDIVQSSVRLVYLFFIIPFLNSFIFVISRASSHVDPLIQSTCRIIIQKRLYNAPLSNSIENRRTWSMAFAPIEIFAFMI